MSEDWAVRTARPASLEEVLRVVTPAVGRLGVRTEVSEQWVVVTDGNDRPRVWIGRPHRSADGQGVDLDLCATGHDVVAEYGAPESLVRDVAGALASALGGVAERRSLAIVPDEPDLSAPYQALPDDCPADALTDTQALVIQSQQRIALTPWLVHQQQWVARHGLGLTVVTPATSSLTPAASAMLRVTGSRWVVDTGDTLYDGHLGLRLSWDGREFSASDDLDPAFAPLASDTWAPLVHAEVVHPYDAPMRIGELTADVCRSAGLTPPSWAGIIEPPESAYDPELITDVAQQVSPGPSRFVITGSGFDGMLDVIPQPPGVVEQMEVTADPRHGRLPSEALAEFAVGVIDAGAEIAVLGYRRSTGGRLVPSRMTGPTVPAVAVFARRRFPDLSDAGALRLAGRSARLVETPLPAVVVEYDAEPGTPEGDEAAARLIRLIEGLAMHDIHLRDAGA
ncbi:DUF6177 family protein [Luteipulveratus halotolerans]|uniref:Uncharacterized protein n=1 Tax=Luteipulveratus halotolerans TaxID=1631356 RepID=A0A0L6CLT8_9MICO|nr:DUF6177 family protein [Luteipulveratus halotolerans]KNX38600.1 hypothetical protein VV01_17960 [Luteipulveratus halotolerans]